MDKNKGTLTSITNENPIARRDFLGLLSIWSCISAGVLACIGLIKFPMPALLPDASSVFKIGKASDLPIGGSKIHPKEKVLVKRDKAGISAVSLICTHLGCVVSVKHTGDFVCPCHGSKFDTRGHVTAGPAPKGLNWLEVSRLPSGRLVVDRSKTVPEDVRFIV